MARILPPRLFLTAMAIIIVIGFLPGAPLAGETWVMPTRILGDVLFLFGASVMWRAHGLFQRQRAEINTFARPRNFVTDGPFQFSRNPMYLAFTLMLGGAAIFVNSLWAMLLPVVFFTICNWHYIPFEERRAQAEFGAEYLDYKTRVRRWL